MPIIPNDPTSLIEYRSGGAFYIRSKTQPHSFWYLEDGWVSVDPRKATMFRIDREDSSAPVEPYDGQLVLERKDRVQLTALTASGEYVIGISGLKLGTGLPTLTFNFGDFYVPTFGIGNPGKDTDTLPAYILYKAEFAGEVWDPIY
jgi:hypothetical protein